MADPDENDLSPEEILRRAKEAFNKGCRLFEVGHLPEAIEAFMRSLELNRQVEDTERQQAACLFNTGLALRRVGRYEEALTAFQQVLGLYRTLPGTQKDQAACLFNTGAVLGETGRYEEALTAHQDALAAYRTLPDTQENQADCLNNTGATLCRVGRYKEALTAYQQTADFLRALPDTQLQQTKCLYNIGNTLYGAGRYEEALTIYQQAADFFHTLPGTQKEQADCLFNTGIALRRVGRYEEARTSCRQALTPAIINALESNAARFQFPNEHDRLTWLTERAEPSLALALRLASINDQPALISDLIATFRTGGSIDTTRLTAQGRTTTLGLITPDLAIHPEPDPHPVAPVPTGLALTASPPLGADAVLSANLPRRPGPVLHMPYQRTALADYRQDDDTTRPHAHYR